jgi:pimeloyl-ACP methyl ester carboxylesterase
MAIQVRSFVMKKAIWALLLLSFSVSIYAQEPPAGQRPTGQVGPLQSEKFSTEYIRLGQQGEGLLYKPANIGAKAHIAVVFTHPNDDNFNAPIGRELASRGYLVMTVNYRGNEAAGNDYRLPTVSLAIGYLRSLAGVQKVIVAGHSGGAHMMTLYENVAEHGSSACNGPEKVYACRAPGLDHLQKPDGLIVLDPPPGVFHSMSSLDPAVTTDDNVRNPALDMFAAANGFDAAAGRASYSSDFAKRFFAAQSARNGQVLAHVLERLKAVETGKGEFTNDEPLVVPGLGVDAGGARLFQPDPSFITQTKAPHLLLKADGTRVETIIHSVRPPNAGSAQQLHTLGSTSSSTTLRGFLSHTAIRTNADFAFTKDDIVGVDWRSAYDSAPGNAYGITVPTLVLTMGCHYLIVPGELVYDHLAAKDKTYATVEGATHGFTPCKAEYGDTTKTTFDFVDEWLSKGGRF